MSWPLTRAPRPAAPFCSTADMKIAASAQKREFTQHFPAAAGSSMIRRIFGPPLSKPRARRWTKVGAKAKDIAAIGITNQRETTLVWDKASGKPVAQRDCLAGPTDGGLLRGDGQGGARGRP